MKRPAASIGWHCRLIVFLVGFAVVLGSDHSHGTGSPAGSNDETFRVQKEYYRLLNAAKKGDADSKVHLFRFFVEHHRTLAPHVQTVIDNLAEAAALEDGDALFLLGQVLDDGMFVAENDEEALKFFLVAAQIGHWKAMSRSIVLFAESARTEENSEERQTLVRNARHWNQQLQQHPDAPQKWKLEGKFTAGTASVASNLDDQEGWKLLGEAARAGHPEAVDYVRDMYEIALDSGKEDQAEAARVIATIKPIIDDIGLSRE